MKVALIGARASGKTTIGRLLAQGRGIDFVDLDVLALEQTGEGSVRAVFATKGEAAWRAAEAAALGEVVARRGSLVLALGGGTPIISAARAMLEAEQRAGRLVIVYLRCSAEELVRRLSAEPGDRPALTGAAGADVDPASEVADVLRVRTAIYVALADVICDAEGSAAEVVEELKGALGWK